MELDIILQDIKPDNIMIVNPIDSTVSILSSDTFKLVLIDFGLSKQFESSCDSRNVCGCFGTMEYVCLSLFAMHAYSV